MKTLLSLVSVAALTLAARASTPTSNPTSAGNAVGTLPEFTVTASRTPAASDDGKIGQMAEFIVVEKATPAKKSPANTTAPANSTHTPAQVATTKPTTVAASGL